MEKKEYFDEKGEFKLTRELIESIPSISSVSMSSYALDKEGIFLFFNAKILMILEKLFLFEEILIIKTNIQIL